MKIKLALTACFLTLLSLQCFAAAPPPPPPPSFYNATAIDSSRTDTRAYAGFGWTFGVKTVFEIMLGIRSTHADSSGKVSGADISASAPLIGFDSVKVKAKFLNGTSNGQGAIGLGYIFGTGKILGTAEYNLPYFSAGADVVLGSGFEPFVSVNTMGKLSKPSPTYSCMGVPATLIGTRCKH